MSAAENKARGTESGSGFVLIVDDDVSVRRGLSTLFRSAGLKVEAFASAAEMEQSPQSDAANCLVLDVKMPTLNGIEFQEQLARSERQIPIIFITGHADVPMTVRAMKGGAIDFFTKPLDGGAILDAVTGGDRPRPQKAGKRNCRRSTAGCLQGPYAPRAGSHAPCNGRAHEQADRRGDGAAGDNGEDSPRQHHEKNESQVASRSGQDGRQPAAPPAHDLSTLPTFVCVVGAIRLRHFLAREQSAQKHPGSPVILSKIPVISIVDDDRSVRNATNRLMRSLGFIAHTFASADEFLKSPYVNRSSCLIVDVRMPNMTGLELQSVLLDKGIATPMIFMTAFPEENDRARALEAGAVDFLTKPFDGKTMARALSAALKGHSTEANERYREP